MKKSFTIIELLVYIGIFSIILIILTQIITSTLNVHLESQSTSSVEQDGKYILSRLSYDISKATKIINPLVGISSDNLIIKINGINYHYYWNNGNLMLDKQTGTPIRLNSYDTTIPDPSLNPDNLSFTRFDSTNSDASDTDYNLDLIQIKFTAISISRPKSGHQVRKFKTTIGLRCYHDCN